MVHLGNDAFAFKKQFVLKASLDNEAYCKLRKINAGLFFVQKRKIQFLKITK